MKLLKFKAGIQHVHNKNKTMTTTTTTTEENAFITRLKTVAKYARKIDKSPQRVYQMAEEGKVRLIQIDGVKFILEQ